MTRRILYAAGRAAGNVIGLIGLVVVCIADDWDARHRARQQDSGS